MGLARITGEFRRLTDFRRLGDQYRDDRRWPEAAQCYRQHLQSYETDFAIWVQLGNCLKEAASYDDALMAYERAISVKPGDADVYLQRGHLEKLMGRRAEAIISYRASLELEPNDNEALRELLLLGAQAEAAEVLRVAQQPRAERESSGVVGMIRTADTTIRTRKRRSGKRLRILYISDSLGTPVHPRGIFYYSIALTEMLASLGAEITLVIEKADKYGLDRDIIRNRGPISRDSLNSSWLSEIYRYFVNDFFDWNVRFRNIRIQRIFEKMPMLFRLFYRIFYLFVIRPKYHVKNGNDVVDFVPGKGAHLRRFDEFLYISRFYSDSLSRAALGLPAVPVNAAGYDAVIIDTPHHVRVRHVRRSRVFMVIHDLIPLRDPFMWTEFRKVFLAKLKTGLAKKGNIIFVSEYTRSLFYSQFPRYTPNGDVVIYPTIRRDQLHGPVSVSDGSSSLIKRIDTGRINDRRYHIEQRARRFAEDPERRAALIKEFETMFLPWDASLPYFSTVVSDEPRKNIAIFPEVSARFVGKCNFIVIGRVNGNAYMRDEPESFPNLHFTGYVEDREKAEILQNAAGLIFPSFSEGFGIPIVEGALLSIPILCSNIQVFREVAGEDASYFDPYSVEELAFRIDQVLQDPAGHADMARKLREAVARRFSQTEMQPRLRQILREVGVLKAGSAGAGGDLGAVDLAAGSAAETRS